MSGRFRPARISHRYRRLGAVGLPQEILMRKTTVSLFSFLEDVLGLQGRARENRQSYGEVEPSAPATDAIHPGAVNENEVRGLAPMVSIAVSVCPVPPVFKRA